jgi:hypothetical protein
MKKEYDFSKVTRGAVGPSAVGQDANRDPKRRRHAGLVQGPGRRQLPDDENQALRRTMEVESEGLGSTLRRVLREELPRLRKAGS